jgi:ribosomal protein L18E
MPLYRRIPKRGFNNARFRTVYAIVNLGQLEVAFADGAAVDATAIRGARLVNAAVGPIKVLGNGDLSKKLHVTADRFSESAKKKIEALGGSATALNPAPVWKPKPPPPVKRPKPEAAGAPPAEAEAPAKGKKEKGAAPEAPPAKKPKGPPPGKTPKDPPAAT